MRATLLSMLRMLSSHEPVSDPVLTADVCLLEDRTLLAAQVPEFFDPNPDAGNEFGSTVLALSTGNVVITSPRDDAGGTDAGAVYLFNGQTGALISTLTGSSANDNVGSEGVLAVGNGNFVVLSGEWDNGAAVDAGAVTWGSGITGVEGVVSSANSLVGSTASDTIGDAGVRVLTNGNYVVLSQVWDNGAIANAGAATWGNGATGRSGVVSAANSLVGTTPEDMVGSGGVELLANGNYVVRSFSWDNGGATNAGAVTWGNGVTGVVGAVSASNSLVGTTTDDGVGNNGVTALTNGNFVVTSPDWDNGSIVDAGAVTWGNGAVGLVGAVSDANSLVGTTTGDKVGNNDVTVLTNGNFVVSSTVWDNGGVANVGAVTWGNGATGRTGAVDTGNSLVGSTAEDAIGGSVEALSNGNYVVVSSGWDNGGVVDAGAVTFGNGTTGRTGTVSAANSLVGATQFNQVGSGGVTALTNGNYVVRSSQWDDGSVVNVGAVTRGNGTFGTIGVVSSDNSLVGSTSGDQVGSSDVVALTNGNYVVLSEFWDNNLVADAGAATWGDGVTGVTGTVSAANSFVGSTAGDEVGDGGAIALTNGNYVVRSNDWNNGLVSDVGAVTWGNGVTGSTGVVSAANSLIGSTSNDRVGSTGVTALTNGNYVVRSRDWDNGSESGAGAATWGNGATGSAGVVSAANSLVGSEATDNVGSSITVLANGNYVVRSSSWDNGPFSSAGAVTFARGTGPSAGAISSFNSLVGKVANAGSQSVVVDDVNGVYYAVFGSEGSGKVRAGSIVNGSAPAEPDIQLFDGPTELTTNLSQVNFGSTTQGTPLPRTIVIRNAGLANLTLQALTVPAGYLVTAGITAGQVLAPDANLNITIALDATFAGAVNGQLTLTTSDPDEAAFRVTLQGKVNARIIDDGDAGFTTTAGWTASTTGRGNDVRFSAAGAGANVATWTFAGLAAGSYRVSTTWPASGNRSNNAPYRIRETASGADLLTATINQRANPLGFADQGTVWQDIGRVTMAGNQLLVQLSNNTSTGIVIADAVRIERIPAVIIDDGQAGFGVTGAWTGTNAGRDGDARFAAAGTGASVATWTFTGLAAGHYNLAATWVTASNRATNAPYRIRETVGGADLLTTAINQRVAPATFSAQGSTWQDLGTVTIAGNQLVVQLTNNTATGFVMADAIRLERVPAVIVDDGQPAFSLSGAWTVTNSGRDNDARFAAAGAGASIATWTFTGLAAGQYTLAATWMTANNRATNAPFRVRATTNGPDLLTTAINQRVAPASFTAQGSTWQTLGTVTITGNQLVVQLTNNTATGFVMADAIRLVRGTTVPRPAEIAAPLASSAEPAARKATPLTLALRGARAWQPSSPPSFEPARPRHEDFAAFYREPQAVEVLLGDVWL